MYETASDQLCSEVVDRVLLELGIASTSPHVRLLHSGDFEYSLLQIKELDPYVYVYCQNNGLVEDKVHEMMGPLMDRGEVVKLDNKGREGKPQISEGIIPSRKYRKMAT